MLATNLSGLVMDSLQAVTCLGRHWADVWAFRQSQTCLVLSGPFPAEATRAWSQQVHYVSLLGGRGELGCDDGGEEKGGRLRAI